MNGDPKNAAYASEGNGAQEIDAAAWTPSEEGIANGLPKTKTVLQARGTGSVATQHASFSCLHFVRSRGSSLDGF